MSSRPAACLLAAFVLSACSGGNSQDDKPAEARDYARQACGVLTNASVTAGRAVFIKAWLDQMEPAIGEATTLAASADIRDSRWSRLRLALADTQQEVLATRDLIDEVVSGYKYLGRGREGADALTAQIAKGAATYAKVTAECQVATAK